MPSDAIINEPAPEPSNEETEPFCAPGENEIDEKSREFYREVVTRASASGIPFLVGGAHAFNRYTGIRRRTKDFDLFIHPRDLARLMEVFSQAGYRTEIASPYWLGKIYSDDNFVDIIFGSGKGINDIDDEWFTYAVEDEVLGLRVMLCPPEEIIWSKAYIMERGRYDGADIAHLFRACMERIEWSRLLQRFNEHWQLLFSHLVLFGFIYPSDRARVPGWVMRNLIDRLENEMKSPPPEERICQGTLLSRDQYLVDVDCWGYLDARPVAIRTEKETPHP